jgi:hypothetical protein
LSQLTSASITLHIEALVRQGALVLFEPELDADQSHCRCVWLHPQVSRWINKAGLFIPGEDYYANVREFLKGFVIGHDFDDDQMLRPLTPIEEGVWEFRVQFEPKARIFGGFLEPCVFFATNYKDRNFLDLRGFAGDRQRCRAIWKGLFPDHPRIVNLSRQQLLEW